MPNKESIILNTKRLLTTKLTQSAFTSWNGLKVTIKAVSTGKSCTMRLITGWEEQWKEHFSSGHIKWRQEMNIDINADKLFQWGAWWD